VATVRSFEAEPCRAELWSSTPYDKAALRETVAMQASVTLFIPMAVVRIFADELVQWEP
jgi:hypothetical protein